MLSRLRPLVVHILHVFTSSPPEVGAQLCDRDTAPVMIMSFNMTGADTVKFQGIRYVTALFQSSINSTFNRCCLLLFHH